MNEEKQEPKLSLEDVINYTSISTAAESDNPVYVNYSLESYLESKSDFEKRELEPWVNALRQEINGTNSIPDWGKRALQNYQRLYFESLQESKVKTIIDVAKKTGYEPADFSNLVNPDEKYGDLMATYKEVAKKEQVAQIDGKQPELTEEEQKLKHKMAAIQRLQDMIRKTIIYSYDKKASNDALNGLNENYKPKEQLQEQPKQEESQEEA